MVYQCYLFTITDTIKATEHSINIQTWSSGTTLHLYHKNQIVATGIAVEGQVLHGKSLPSSLQKVAITDVLIKNTKLLFTTTFDDEFVAAGQIIAWPKKLLKTL